MAQTSGLSRPSNVVNYLINGNMDFWQRGNNFASISQFSYYPDRWANQSGANTSASISQQSLAGVQAATFATRWTAGSTSSQFNFTQPIENIIVNQIKGKYVTFSIYARINSGNNRTYSIAIYKNATANVLSTGSWSIINASTATTLTTSFQRLSVTAFIPNDGTANGIRVAIFDNQTGLAADYIEIVGAMLNDGFSPSSSFLLYGGDLSAEFVACQRYYEASGQTFRFQNIDTVGRNSFCHSIFSVRKRASPSVTLNNTGQTNVGAFSFNGSNSHHILWQWSGNGSAIDFQNTANWTADAEL